jgi:hypothetical protein
MRTGQQVRAAKSREPRSASAKASLEVPAVTAGAARTGSGTRSDQVQPVRPALGIRLLTADEVSPLGYIRSSA